MNLKAFLSVATLLTAFAGAVFAQDAERTSPFTAAEKEAIYTTNIEKRTADILKALALTDTNKVSRVHDAIMAQYRSLRARDEALDTMFNELAKNAPGVETNRVAVLPALSQTLHSQFLGKLSADLAPQEIEIVKNKLTYNKVKVTYDAYCAIVPRLDEKDKAKILELLKEAREGAMDGGSATEKTEIFQRYKDQINTYLATRGHDVDKAIKEWELRQEQAKSQSATTAN